MGGKVILLLAFLVILVQGIPDEEQPHPSEPMPLHIHPLRPLIVIFRENRQNSSNMDVQEKNNKMDVEEKNSNGTEVTEDQSRVKRQTRRYPIPVLAGGGGYPSRGFGGRANGGRGMAGRGFGGRGIGGRGIGGRGIGGRGIGGRGGIGGGRGGRG